MRGNFTIVSNSDLKYMWQYQYDIAKSSFFHVIRPLFTPKSNIRFWQFETRKNIENNIEINLELPDKFIVEEISIKEKSKVHFTITWKLSMDNWITNTVLNLSTKAENNLNLMQSFENTDFTEFLSNCDEELDEFVLFFQKMSNYIQILQDNLNDESDIDNKKKYINDLLIEIKKKFKNEKSNTIDKKITYIGINE